MIRKKSTYRPRPLTVPMLINRGLAESDIEVRERMLVEAFGGGWATTQHFDDITDMRNVLTLAAAYKSDAAAIAICEAMRIPSATCATATPKPGAWASPATNSNSCAPSATPTATFG